MLLVHVTMVVDTRIKLVHEAYLWLGKYHVLIGLRYVIPGPFPRFPKGKMGHMEQVVPEALRREATRRKHLMLGVNDTFGKHLFNHRLSPSSEFKKLLSKS